MAVALVAGILIGIYLPGRSSAPQQSGFRARNDKINSILNIIESDYVDTVNRAELVEAAIPAILEKA